MRNGHGPSKLLAGITPAVDLLYKAGGYQVVVVICFLTKISRPPLLITISTITIKKGKRCITSTHMYFVTDNPKYSNKSLTENL
jgi:hypothetical protein